jgi:glycine cleavage system H protein
MYYSDSHEWVRVEGEKGTVGISKHAQKELGEIVYVQLPKVGQEVKAGEEVVILESTKAAADIYSPVSGKIVKVNEALKEDIALINISPENEGYLFEIVLTHPDEIKKLIPQSDYLSGMNH